MVVTMNQTMLNVFLTLSSVIVGGIITFFTESFFRKRNNKQLISQGASILKLDLIYISEYFSNNDDNMESKINIRYNNDWQSLLINCSFLTSQQSKEIYDIFNYTYEYHCKFDNAIEKGMRELKLDSLNHVQIMMLIIDQNHEANSFKELISALDKHILKN